MSGNMSKPWETARDAKLAALQAARREAYKSQYDSKHRVSKSGGASGGPSGAKKSGEKSDQKLPANFAFKLITEGGHGEVMIDAVLTAERIDASSVPKATPTKATSTKATPANAIQGGLPNTGVTRTDGGHETDSSDEFDKLVGDPFVDSGPGKAIINHFAGSGSLTAGINPFVRTVEAFVTPVISSGGVQALGSPFAGSSPAQTVAAIENECLQQVDGCRPLFKVKKEPVDDAQVFSAERKLNDNGKACSFNPFQQWIDVSGRLDGQSATPDHAARSLTSQDGTKQDPGRSTATTIPGHQLMLPVGGNMVPNKTNFDDPFTVQTMIDKAVKTALTEKDEQLKYLKVSHAAEILNLNMAAEQKLNNALKTNNMVVSQLQTSLEWLKQSTVNDKVILAEEFEDAACNIAAEKEVEVRTVMEEKMEVERLVQVLNFRIGKMKELLFLSDQREHDLVIRIRNAEAANEELNRRLAVYAQIENALTARVDTLEREESNLQHRLTLAEDENLSLATDIDHVIELGEGLLDAFEFKERAYERIIKRLSPSECPNVRVASQAIKEAYDELTEGYREVRGRLRSDAY